MNIMLHENERLDDLEYNGLKIIQKKDGYCFTSDSILLSGLARVKTGDRVVDIGTGSGVIPILLAAKHHPSKIVGLELQERLADMARRSVEWNGLSDTVEIVHAPAQGAEKRIGTGYDVVVSNPPYEKKVEKERFTEREICKSEVFLTAEECVETAEKLLKFGGLLYMIHKVKRMADVLCAMRQKRIEPKRLFLIQPKADIDFDTFVVEGKKGGKPDLLVPKPLVIYEKDGAMTEFARRIYGK